MDGDETVAADDAVRIRGLKRRSWDDSPLPRKMAMLLALAVTGGAAVGAATVNLPWGVVPLIGGLGVTYGALHIVSQRWIWRPYERLLRQLNIVRLRRRAAALRELPVERIDEIGAIARSMHEISLIAIQSTAEAQQLRRTLDQRIEQATRQACGQLQQLAMRDPLTDLANRRFLDEQLNTLIHSLADSGEDLVCILIDLDNFKQVNDELGHSAGDDVLVFLAGLMKGLVRREDFAVRLGGDEFAVFMPGCNAQRGEKFAHQLTGLFRQHVRATVPADLSCDLSIGIATLSRDLLHDESEEDAPLLPSDPGHVLLERADHRLYAAKRAGKAQVMGA